MLQNRSKQRSYSLARYVATRTVRVLAKELVCRRHRQGCVFFLHCRIAHDSCGQVLAKTCSPIKRKQKTVTRCGETELQPDFHAHVPSDLAPQAARQACKNESPRSSHRASIGTAFKLRRCALRNVIPRTTES